MNQKSKNTVKNRWDCVGIFTCVSICVGYSYLLLCVCMCEWYIGHVHVKVCAPRVVFTGC